MFMTNYMMLCKFLIVRFMLKKSQCYTSNVNTQSSCADDSKYAIALSSHYSRNGTTFQKLDWNYKRTYYSNKQNCHGDLLKKSNLKFRKTKISVNKSRINAHNEEEFLKVYFDPNKGILIYTKKISNNKSDKNSMLANANLNSSLPKQSLKNLVKVSKKTYKEKLNIQLQNSSQIVKLENITICKFNNLRKNYQEHVFNSTYFQNIKTKNTSKSHSYLTKYNYNLIKTYNSTQNALFYKIYEALLTALDTRNRCFNICEEINKVIYPESKCIIVQKKIPNEFKRYKSIFLKHKIGLHDTNDLIINFKNFVKIIEDEFIPKKILDFFNSFIFATLFDLFYKDKKIVIKAHLIGMFKYIPELFFYIEWEVEQISKLQISIDEFKEHLSLVFSYITTIVVRYISFIRNDKIPERKSKFEQSILHFRKYIRIHLLIYYENSIPNFMFNLAMDNLATKDKALVFITFILAFTLESSTIDKFYNDWYKLSLNQEEKFSKDIIFNYLFSSLDSSSDIIITLQLIVEYLRSRANHPHIKTQHNKYIVIPYLYRWVIIDIEKQMKITELYIADSDNVIEFFYCEIHELLNFN